MKSQHLELRCEEELILLVLKSISMITTTGSYLGSYGGFSIYNTHGNCGFDIERLNPEIHKENIYDPESDSDSESDYSYDYFDPYGDVNSNDYNYDSDEWWSD